MSERCRRAALLWWCGLGIFVLGLWPLQVKAEAGVAPPEVAVIAPLSGELAPLGEQLVEAATLAALDREVKIRPIDEGDSVEETLSAVAAAAEAEEVVAAIGPVIRRHSGTAAREAQRRGLPLISFASSAGVERQGVMIFRGRLSPEEHGRQVASRMVEDLKVERIAVMAPRTGYGDSVVTSLVDSVHQLGAKTSAMSRYEEGTTDFGPVLKRLIGQSAYVGVGRQMSGVDRYGLVDVPRDGEVKFDALLIADSHAVVARILPFLPRFDIGTGATDSDASVQLVGLSGWRGDGLQRVSDHARGAVFFDTFGGEVDGSNARQFAIDYREKMGREVTTPEAEIYDLVTLITDAERHGREVAERRRAVVQFLHSMEAYEGVAGSWSFDRFGAPVREMRGYRVGSGGQWMPIPGGK